ncbi:MAG: family 1 glycosylhydrolase [Candidatus Omnitrophica bacterium]|nr:family 1 glycosylhydrolase [Candidatus Omnitrophota bacterium]
MVSQKGGWLNPDSPEIFLRFVKRVVEEFSGKVSFWVTINEPIVYAYHAYALGVWPPQEKSFRKTEIVIDNLFAAHTKAYRSIHDIYREKGSSSPYVGFAKNVQAFYPCIPTLRNKIAVKIRHSYYNMNFIEKALRLGALDFIGINYYSRSLVETKNWTPASLAIDVCPGGHSKLKKNSLGWDIYPEGFYSLLMNFKKYNLPIFILENGICTDDDSLRWDFIRDHLLKVGLAMQDGVKVMGYIYWSLIDNYEWDKGFAPRFGLIDVNYRTFERKIRESAKLFGEVIKAGALE